MMIVTEHDRRVRLAQIRQRIFTLQCLMGTRGSSDPCLDLVQEHRDLVRERNRLREGGKTT